MTRKTREFKSEIKTVELVTLSLDNLPEAVARIRDAFGDRPTLAGKVFCEVYNAAHRRSVDPMSQISQVWYTTDGVLA